MAKVTIILEDVKAPSGEWGLGVDVTSDPEMKKDQVKTLAQEWTIVLLDLILQHSKEVEVDEADVGPINGSTH